MIKKNENVLVLITLKGKRSWRKVRDILKEDGFITDFRKRSKTNIPFVIACGGNCKGILEIRMIKDFPLTDRRCSSCGNYFIKWETENDRPQK